MSKKPNDSSIVTISLPYECKEESNRLLIDKLINQYNHVFRSMFNRFNKGKPCKFNDFDFYNDIEMLDSWYKQSAIYDAKSLLRYDKDHNFIRQTIIFGGKKNFLARQKVNGRNRISKEEYKKNRLRPLYCIGEKKSGTKSVHSNRKFHILEDLSSILFSLSMPDAEHPDKKIKIPVILHISENLNKNYRNILGLLYLHQQAGDMAITYKLDSERIYIVYDENLLFDKNTFQCISDRILSIDDNPNYKGWSVIQWKNEKEFDVIASGIISIKELNDLEKKFKGKHFSSSSEERIHLTNVRQFIATEIAKDLIAKAIHFKCEYVVLEDLNIKHKDGKKGNNYNRLVNNNWCRNQFSWQIEKRCNRFSLKLMKVNPAYSSTIGNFLFRSLDLPDPCLASIELSRRCYEIKHKLIVKDIACSKDRNGKYIKDFVIQPSIQQFYNMYVKSLEEFNICTTTVSDFKQIHEILKNSKMMYRVSLDCLQENPKLVKYSNWKHPVYQYYFTKRTFSHI